MEFWHSPGREGSRGHMVPMPMHYYIGNVGETHSSLCERAYVALPDGLPPADAEYKLPANHCSVCKRLLDEREAKKHG